jgi:hypothetical protein
MRASTLKYLYWASVFVTQLPLVVLGRILSPFACLFIVSFPVIDHVKRYNKELTRLDRDNLVWWLSWFATDDNNVDEYWYGVYGNTLNKTQEYYDTHIVYRWWCRVLWLQRNNLYTFKRKFFGLAKDSKLAWQYRGNSFIKGRTINIGWKAHKGIDTLMFAGRIF